MVIEPKTPSLYLRDRIHAEWDKFHTHMKESDIQLGRDQVPPHLQSIENEARRLDELLSSRIKDKVQMWQDGLIATVELADYMYQAAYSVE